MSKCKCGEELDNEVQFDHRLLCGDSTNQADVDRLMNGNKAELLFTSPPYADMREYNGEKDLSVSNLIKFIDVFAPICQYQIINLGIKRDKHEIVSYWDEYIARARAMGYKFLAWNVWAKQNAGSVGNQSAFIPISHEWIFVFGKDFKDINRIEERKTKVNKKKTTRSVRQQDGSIEKSSVGKQEYLKEMESVFFMNTELGKIRDLHPATFPIELPDKYIRSITDPEQGVVDPFMGSGSTLIAAEKSGRKCYGMELDPSYCDVVVERYKNYSNKLIHRNGEKM